MGAFEDAERDEEHIRHDMIECESDKCRRGPPDGENFRHYFATANGAEDGKTDEPICSDGSEENLMPLGIVGFLCGEAHCCLLICGGFFKDAAVADDDQCEEEHAAEVSEIGNYPAFEHVPE